jgi:hypothetical protein
MAKRKAKEIKRLKVSEISHVDKGSNPGAQIVLKRGQVEESDPETLEEVEKMLGEMDEQLGDDDGDEKSIDGDDVAKGGDGTDAINFDTAVDQQFAYRRMSVIYDYTSALQSSLRSILADKDVKDKAKPIGETLDQFKAAVIKALTGPITTVAKNAASAGSDATGVSGQEDEAKEDEVSKAAETNGAPATKGDNTDLMAQVTKMVADAVAPLAESIKTVAETVQKSAQQRVEEDAVSKAAQYKDIPGVKQEDLVAVFKSGNADAIKAVEASLSAQRAVLKQSALFGEIGTSGSNAKEGEETPLMKASKQRAAELEKKFSGRAA